MKSLLRAAIAVCLALAPFYAFPAEGLVDSLAFLARSPQYAALLEGLWNAEDAEVCQGLRDAAEAASEDLGGAEALCLSMKADLAIARYWACGPAKSGKKARACLRAAEEKLGRLDPRFEGVSLATLAEIRGLEHTISPLSLGKGLEAKRLTERAREENPGEVSAVLMYANTRLYAPAFAGQDVDEALELFSRLLAFPSLAPWDRFSVLSGLGMCLKRKGRPAEAKARLAEAMAIYHGDGVIIKALKELGN